MIIIKSTRAKKLLENTKHQKNELSPLMRRYPGSTPIVWVELEWEHNNVKNLSFFGELEPHEKILLESMASLTIGKPIIVMDSLTLRECEAFLRDRNSESAIEGMSEGLESDFKKLFQWIRQWPRIEPAKNYAFSSEKGPFRTLKQADKIREVKAFLNSPEILTLYQNLPRPELVDMEDLTVYIHAAYSSDIEKSLFEELHIMGVEVFQEENLNFIPET